VTAAAQARPPPASPLFDPAPRRIAVFRALHLGDLLCSVPALRALRSAAPQAHIALVGLPWARDFVARFGAYLDELVEFPGYPGFPEREAGDEALQTFLQRSRRRRYDLVIQLHGTGYEVNPIALAMGARHCAGFHPQGSAAPTPWFVPWPEDQPEIRRYLRLTDHIGAATQGEHLEFPLNDDDRAQAATLLRAHSLAAMPYVCLHAGARLPSRRWPPERFAWVADYLVRTGLPVLLTGGAGETALAAAVLEHVPPRQRPFVHNLAGKTTLGSLAALVAHARLVVSNDTGLSHVAAAVRTPSVVISSGGDARRWAPLDHRHHRVLWHDLPCRPCAHETCPIGHPCALAIEPLTVAEAVEAVMHHTEPRYE
jgi:ADP-heptose:LPS heptosyltransferase